MDHSRTSNRPIGSPVERLEDLRFLRGRGQYRRRRAEPGRAARRDPAQLGRARPHPLDRRVRRAEASRRARGHHRRRHRRRFPSSPCGRSCCRSSSRSSSRSSPTTRCATSASRSPSSSPTARRSPRMRWSDRARHRAAAAGRRPRGRARRQEPAVRGQRPQPRHHAVRRQRRRRRGVPERALHPPRALRGAALHRRDRWRRAACSPNGTRRKAT